MTYDLEALLSDIETLLKDKLNAKILAIENEKTSLGKPIGLKEIAANAYFEQTWNDKVSQYTPAIFFGVEEIAATGSGPVTLEAYKIFVEVVVLDNGMDGFSKNRVHRYSRALKEVFQENFDQLPWGTKTKIETVRPISFKLDLDSSDEIKVGGVSITTSLA